MSAALKLHASSSRLGAGNWRCVWQCGRDSCCRSMGCLSACICVSRGREATITAWWWLIRADWLVRCVVFECVQTADATVAVSHR
jgi:hypothetical protein